MSLLTACATNRGYIEPCEEPELSGGKYPRWLDLYEYAQHAQGALRECNVRIKAHNSVY